MTPSPQYWIMKSEPSAYSFADLLRDGETHWDGVRNYQARNNMKAMAVGDWVLFYESMGPKELVGVAQVSKAHYPDPTDDTGRWVWVNIKPVTALQQHVSLADIKSDNRVNQISLVTQSRLSVLPLDKPAFDHLLKLGKTKL